MSGRVTATQSHRRPGSLRHERQQLENVRQLTFDLHDDGQPTWSPDGSEIVFVHQMFSPEEEQMGLSNHDLWMMRANGSHQRAVTVNPFDDHEPNWSPDGRKIAFTTNPSGNSDVYTIRPDGSHLRRLTGRPRIRQRRELVTR